MTWGENVLERFVGSDAELLQGFEALPISIPHDTIAALYGLKILYGSFTHNPSLRLHITASLRYMY